MVHKMRKKVNSIIADLETKLNIKLDIDFKWKMNIFAIQKFKIHMLEIQEIWDKENNPLILLKNNKENYIKWIEDKLVYDINFYKDGSKAGSSLLSAIRQKSIKTANNIGKHELLNQNWILNSAKID